MPWKPRKGLFKEWPKDAPREMPTPDVIEMYKDGFAGATHSAEAWDDFEKSMAFPDGDQVVHEFGLADSGAGKLVIPFVLVLEMFPGCWPGRQGQARGDCVSWGTRNAALLTMVCDIVNGKPDEKTGVVEGPPEVPPEGIADGVLSTEAIYWYRGYNGDGWHCPTAAKVATTKGGCIIRKDYPELGFDLTTYSGKKAGLYGSKSPPAKVLDMTDDHLIHQATQDSAFEFIRDMLFNGYGISTCGGEGLSNKRDEWGVSKRSGSWAHAMAFCGADDRDTIKQKYGEPLVLDLNCYSDDTEILTEDGWVSFPDLREAVRVATLNPKTHTLEYHLPTAYHRYRHDGEMIAFHSRGVDLLVTPNHQMYALSGHKKNAHGTDAPEHWYWCAAESLPAFSHFRKHAAGWEGKEVSTVSVAGQEIEADDWLEFLGFWLAEGWATIRNRVRVRVGHAEPCATKDCYLGVANSNPDNIEWFRQLSSRLPFRFKERDSNGCTQFMNYNMKLAKALIPFGKAHEKHVPAFVFGLSQRQQKLFLDAMIRGDGQVKAQGSMTYSTTSKQLADDVQRLSLHLGMAADMTTYPMIGKQCGKAIARHDITVVRIKSPDLKTSHLTPMPNGGWCPLSLPYHGDVFCVTVPYHTVYVRRNGKAVWCGQSWAKWNGGPRDIYESAALVPPAKKQEWITKGIVNPSTGNIMIPEGSCWVRYSEMKRRECIAFSGTNGWPAKNLPLQWIFA